MVPGSVRRGTDIRLLSHVRVDKKNQAIIKYQIVQAQVSDRLHHYWKPVSHLYKQQVFVLWTRRKELEALKVVAAINIRLFCGFLNLDAVSCSALAKNSTLTT